MKHHSTAKRLRHFLDESKTGATALRLGINEYSLLEAETALRFAWNTCDRSSSETERERSRLLGSMKFERPLNRSVTLSINLLTVYAACMVNPVVILLFKRKVPP